MKKNIVRCVLCFVLTSLVGMCSSSVPALAVVNDVLYDAPQGRGNNVPTSTLNLSTDSDKTYVGQWETVYSYTYTNKKMCTGDSSQRFKIVLDAYCLDSSYNRTTGTITVEVYNNSGTRVISWSSTGTDPSLTKYYTPATASTYYYFKVVLTNCKGFCAGDLSIISVDR